MHLLPFLKGILIGLIIAIPTGPVGFLVAKRAIVKHYKASISSALGSISADLIFGAIAIFGITAIANFYLNGENTIRLFGGLLLLYVGIKTYYDFPPAIIPGLEKYEHLGNFSSVFALTMTNPIQIITLPVVFTVIGTDVASQNYDGALIFLLGLLVGSIICWALLLSFITAMKKYVKENHFSLINKISGSLVFLTGLYIVSYTIIKFLKF